MTSVRGISHTIIGRLPKYLYYLKELQENHIERVSSTQIAKIMNTTASQVRQDLCSFGSFGATGYGYRVESLIEVLEEILGLDRPHNIIVVGVGSIGRGLLEHMEFGSYHYHVCAAFDIDPEIVGTSVNGIPVYHYDVLEDVTKGCKADVCMLTVSRKSAREVAWKLAELNVPAIWNFTNEDLRLHETDVLVQNVNLLESLFTLTYFLEERN